MFKEQSGTEGRGEERSNLLRKDFILNERFHSAASEDSSFSADDGKSYDKENKRAVSSLNLLNDPTPLSNWSCSSCVWMVAPLTIFSGSTINVEHEAEQILLSLWTLPSTFSVSSPPAHFAPFYDSIPGNKTPSPSGTYRSRRGSLSFFPQNIFLHWKIRPHPFSSTHSWCFPFVCTLRVIDQWAVVVILWQLIPVFSHHVALLYPRPHVPCPSLT